ncbi:hypothetical protein ECC02_008938 [Trypanosoma cruzi]|uniref:Uncharacterized protein n=1 Tax=Trypanosoma cruzi TaxID=5693 RepID=A0A7J6XVC8_TRYCR|nr:hypothetical protein ECC02_008938 [Trypanosoma cruzi]
MGAKNKKQKQLRCSAHAARQDGSGACSAKESTNGPAWVCMQYIQWAHYVCASWDEVRARVHARGHTQRERERKVCVRAVHGSLSLTLTRPPPQQQPHTQQQEEEAKEGRWRGRPRCCCHCRLYLRWHLYEGRFYLSRILRHLPRGVHAVDVVGLVFHHFAAAFHNLLPLPLLLLLVVCVQCRMSSLPILRLARGCEPLLLQTSDLLLKSPLLC